MGLRVHSGIRLLSVNIGRRGYPSRARGEESSAPTSYASLANALIERATRDQLADVARLLPLNIGYYQERYGDVPQDTLLKMVRAEALDEETLALLSAGMQNLISALAEVTGLTDDLEDESRH